ncbi:MAG TPA: peptide-methionine (R)-S-oxide reductase MsrB [Vicinamibacterales bacterium]
MESRRQLLATIAATLGLAPVVAWLGCSEPVSTSAEQRRFPVTRTDSEWRAMLTPQQYRVVRERGTERAFSSPLDHERRRGTFVCAACEQRLFSSATKFDSGTGWPSFWAPLENAVGTSIDRSFFMIRTEVHCARCGGHLGHVFPDGPKPTGQRYCMNGIAMKFIPDV